MKTVLFSFFLLISVVTSKAGAYTFTPTPADLNDLDHHSAYAWRLTGLSLGGGGITGGSITFINIRNWDGNPNTLFIHLLDTALATPTHTRINGNYPAILGMGPGTEVTSFTDASLTQAPVTDINDDFAGTRYLANPLVAPGTGNTFLTSYVNLTTTPISRLTYTFNAAQLAVLQSYISNGNDIAFGFDPDCHFFNDGITFTYSTPEGGATAALFGVGLGAIVLARRKFCA